MPLQVGVELILNKVCFKCKHCQEEFNNLEHIETNCAWSLKRRYRLNGKGKLMEDPFEDYPRDGKSQKIPLTFNDSHGVVGFEVFFQDPRRRVALTDAPRPLLPDAADLPTRDYQRHPKSEFSGHTLERRYVGRKVDDEKSLRSPCLSTSSTAASDGLRDAEGVGKHVDQGEMYVRANGTKTDPIDVKDRRLLYHNKYWVFKETDKPFSYKNLTIKCWED